MAQWEKGKTVSAIGEECPACLMALVMMANRNAGTPDEDGPVGWIQYPNFKDELRDFRNEMCKTSNQIRYDLGILTM